MREEEIELIAEMELIIARLKLISYYGSQIGYKENEKRLMEEHEKEFKMLNTKLMALASKLISIT